MLLKKIHLAGFKSFVDPTTLHFRSELVGVVGPNGCGKSNIIDAVRWVMGESSAKTLRGESMSDVIFNGSSSRQPVGQASIDLVFDNSDGTIKGEYASYAEIAVRREVTRDGQSNYYLNNTRCRKRDIVDVFLGTGLGPRSYSIIEQGMISRIIEAKPEDLRSFFEEAAGIAIYKKRRHETNLRIRHTRDNLTRIADICREQTVQLEKLQKQADAAIRFNELQTEKNKSEVDLLALRWRDYNGKLQTASDQIKVLAVLLEEKLSNRASLDTKLEKMRLDHIEQNDNFNSVQSRFYELGSQIARREQTLQHHQERVLQLREDLSKNQLQALATQEEISRDQVALTDLQQQLAKVIPEYDVAVAQLQQEQSWHLEAKTALQKWQENWHTLQEQTHKLQETAEIEKTRIAQFERQTREQQSRIDRLLKEEATIHLAYNAANLANLEEDYSIVAANDAELKLQLEQTVGKIAEIRQLIQTERGCADSARSQLQVLQGKQAALQTLQQAALQKSNPLASSLLAQHDLTNAARLAEWIAVEPGWELALEIVLAKYLDYICVEDNFADLLPQVAAVQNIKLGILAKSATKFAVASVGEKISIASKITNSAAAALAGLLAKVYIAEDLDQALAIRTSLAGDDSVITKAGVWLGANWLVLHASEDAHFGVLQREQELKNLADQLALSTNELDVFVGNIASQEQELAAYNQQQQELQQNIKTGAKQLLEASNAVGVARARQQNLVHRAAQIKAEIAEYNTQIEDLAEETCIARGQLETAIEAMVEYANSKTVLTAEKEAYQHSLQQAEEKLHAARAQAHALEISKKTLETEQQAAYLAMQRLNKQLATINERTVSLTHALGEDDSPIELVKQELDTLLEQRMLVEEDLHAARTEVENLERQVTSLEKDRGQQEKLAQEVRTELESLRMDWQSLQVRCQTAEEALLAKQVVVAEAVSALPDDAEETSMQENLEKLARKIERLGAINLAAVEEFKAETERQTYLQAQYNDLEEALQTLEQAIHKIDKETKSKFSDTFNQVGENFKKLFPKLFGGGQAYLELTGEDMLEAGITVIARPPGKKNSTIHLLSGGEKALTAVALVFSIFQLNPAPFCMLDEVDAPLDDANVGRYCDMLKEMSSSVQFIFITHNKLTMEIAKQLAGVTMKEPGVSRLVSVDIDEAIQMAVA